jgi:hypothetical protein
VTGTEARLARIRGRAPAKPHNARTIAALASNPGCARRAIMDAAGVDKPRISAHAGFPAPFGQSPLPWPGATRSRPSSRPTAARRSSRCSASTSTWPYPRPTTTT